jgi:hypothetical protein
MRRVRPLGGRPRPDSGPIRLFMNVGRAERARRAPVTSLVFAPRESASASGLRAHSERARDGLADRAQRGDRLEVPRRASPDSAVVRAISLRFWPPGGRLRRAAGLLILAPRAHATSATSRRPPETRFRTDSVLHERGASRIGKSSAYDVARVRPTRISVRPAGSGPSQSEAATASRIAPSDAIVSRSHGERKIRMGWRKPTRA